MIKYLSKWGFILNIYKKPPKMKALLWKSSPTVARIHTSTSEFAGERAVINIPEFYKNKSVFITGATGFAGKVLVARLLATCPDIGKLYLLIRDRRGVNVDQRLQQLKDSEVFDVLRAKSPDQMNKMVAVRGDISETQLGMTPHDRARLDEVSVVFHVAASMGMTDPLRRAVNGNLRSTLHMLDICDRIPNMQVFMYVSTCYSNSELKRVEERVYPPPMDLDAVLTVAENQDLDEEQTSKFVSAKPNTYTFTKALAEYAVQRHGCTNYSAAVFRPAIVIASLRHPFPGWTDNLYGPVRVIAGVATGQLRLFMMRRSARADFVPVDITADTLIAAAWEMAMDKPDEVRVYNNSNPADENPLTWGRFIDGVNCFTPQYPSEKALWYPHFYTTTNRYLYWILDLFLHTIPSYMIEYSSRIFGKKTGVNFIKKNKNIQKRSAELWYFSINDWDFVDGNTKKLRNRLSAKDKKLYNLDLKTIDWDKTLENMVLGTRKHVLKEPDDSLENARARVRRFRYAIISSKAAGALAGLTALSCYIS